MFHLPFIPSTHNAEPSPTSNHYQYVTQKHPFEYTVTPSRPTPQYYIEEVSSHGPPSTPESYITNDSSFIENSNHSTVLKNFYDNIGSEN